MHNIVIFEPENYTVGCLLCTYVYIVVIGTWFAGSTGSASAASQRSSHCPVRQYQMCLLYVSSRRWMRSGRPAQQQGCFDADEAPNHCRIPGHMPGKPGPVHWHDGVHGPACVSDGESCNKKGTTVHLYFLVSNLEQVIGPERLYSIRQPSRHASLYGTRT